MGESAGLLYLGVLVVAFYLLIIRPQMQRTKQMKALMASLAVGDKVITIGGLHGTIVGMEGSAVTLRVADGVELRYEKTAIARTDTAEAGPESVDEDLPAPPEQ
ncbi:MAG: preprotein translocase subunit YajC [Coriobacteriia bacterium]|nr:preprotein translocase subunit YajC [Coriobacteriia bacterium]